MPLGTENFGTHNNILHLFNLKMCQNAPSQMAHKDENEKIFKVNPVCSHLWCELAWNNLEKTWDCPCHGSRFTYDGKSIYAPSIKNLQSY